MFSDWLSCKKFAERVSKDIDGELGFLDKPALWFRIIACSASRKFRRQLVQIDDLFDTYGKSCLCGETDQEENTSEKLSESRINSIAEAMAAESGDSMAVESPEKA